MSKKPVVLMVLDGYGLNDKTEGNAIAQAKTPVMDKLMKECPFQKGNASGLSVGLPDGQMGNSEVGHMNIGAGRIIYQELTRITKAIEEGTFFENKALLAAVENAKKNNSDLHLFGLLSDGGVHSHNTHLYGLLELAKRNGLENVYVHAFLDGRDTAPTSGKGFVEELQKEMDKIGVGKIASVHGRYYAMDRDNNWDRVEKAYNALVKGEGIKADDAVKAVADSYAQDVNDEFVVPTVIEENGKPVATIKANDSVIFFNFRPDRARQITRTFCDESFDKFERANGFMPITFVCFTNYDETIGNKLVAFEKESIENTFGEFLAAHDMTQLRLLTFDREGAVVKHAIKGEKRRFNGETFSYEGPANLKVKRDREKDTTSYIIKLRKDLTFSDETPVTIDDVIFSMYAFADSSYQGEETFGSLPILGLQKYRKSASALDISGIEKMTDYKVKVTVRGYDRDAYQALNIPICSLNFYGDRHIFNVLAGSFGFKKGDLSGLTKKKNAPFGAGAYRFIKYEKGIVYYEANEKYYRGCPQTAFIQLKEIGNMSDVRKLEALENGF